MAPPMAWMVLRATESPSPVPLPTGLVVKNGFEDAREELGGDAGAGVADL